MTDVPSEHTMMLLQEGEEVKAVKWTQEKYKVESVDNEPSSWLQ